MSRRPRTNTPLQALAALNDPTLLEAARVFAQRILAEGGKSDAARVDFAFRATVGRPPTSAEKERLVAFVGQQTKGFRGDRAAAEKLVSVGAATRPSDLDVRQVAAWMMVANVLFNLDETLTKG